MQILPVLDLLHGQVVRGVAGRRSEYRPIVSRLTDSTSPLEIANAFRQTFRLNRLYVADLDAIEGRTPQISIWQHLAGAGFELEIDAGVRSVESVRTVLDSGADSVIVGSESLPSEKLLLEMLDTTETERVVVSLDLVAGEPRTQAEEWARLSPIEIVDRVVSLGVRRLIVLDVRSVGMHGGTGTDSLCDDIRNCFPKLELTTGGGIRSAADLCRQTEIGSDRVLVASALHDGLLRSSDIVGDD